MPATQTRTLRMERIFDASPAQLWEAWTDPLQVAAWWNPAPGIDAEVHEVDARPGGRLRLTMTVPDARPFAGTDRFPVEGTFLVIRPPHELVLRFEGEDGPTATVRFEAVGPRTRMTFEVAGDLSEDERGHMETGWGICFERLGAHVAGRRPDAS